MKNEISVRLARYETARIHLVKAVEELTVGIVEPNISKLGRSKTIYRKPALVKRTRAWTLRLGDKYNTSNLLTVSLKLKTAVTMFLLRNGVDNQTAEDAGLLIKMDTTQQWEYMAEQNRYMYNQEAYVIEKFMEYLDDPGSEDLI